VERCRLVRYDEYTETLDQSFDENKVHVHCMYVYVLIAQYLVLHVSIINLCNFRIC
jgi:hypothetical protein